MAHKNNGKQAFCTKCGDQKVSMPGLGEKIFCPCCGREIKNGRIEGIGLGDTFFESFSTGTTRFSGFGPLLQTIYKNLNRFTGTGFR